VFPPGEPHITSIATVTEDAAQDEFKSIYDSQRKQAGGKRMLRRVIGCRKVMDELSNYSNECITDKLRKQMDEHLRTCDRCSVLLDYHAKGAACRWRQQGI